MLKVVLSQLMSLPKTVSRSHVTRTVIPQAVSRQPLIPDDWVRSPTTSCDIFYGQDGTGTDFSSQHFDFLPSAPLHQCSLLDFILIPLLLEGQAE
jgi:hypothetical protein